MYVTLHVWNLHVKDSKLLTLTDTLDSEVALYPIIPMKSFKGVQGRPVKGVNGW